MEVALAYCPSTQEWTVVTGSDVEVKFPSRMFTDQAGRQWTIVKHFHPGKDLITRVPSAQDFKALMSLHQGGEWQSVVEYLDPRTGAKRYTYYGYDPAASNGKFWVQYMAPAETGAGTVETRRFDSAPFEPAGVVDYQNFKSVIETTGRVATNGPDTVVPSGN
jgi:hypothetical protein